MNELESNDECNDNKNKRYAGFARKLFTNNHFISILLQFKEGKRTKTREGYDRYRWKLKKSDLGFS